MKQRNITMKLESTHYCEKLASSLSEKSDGLMIHNCRYVALNPDFIFKVLAYSNYFTLRG